MGLAAVAMGARTIGDEMKHSESRKEIMHALFNARSEFPKIIKDKSGQAGNRQFKYAPLEVILDIVEPILANHGLMITQPPDGHNIITLLEHVPSGEWRESTMPMNQEHANMQSFGIEMTYRRRYSVQSMLGIVTEEDTDGIGATKRGRGADFTRGADADIKVKSVSNREMAWQQLQPDVQDSARKCCKQVCEQTDIARAYDIAELWCTSQDDPMAAKAGLSFLFDAKTNAALKKYSQEQHMARAVRKANEQAI